MKNVIITALFLIVVCAGQIQASEFGEVEIHGFIAQGYLKSDHNKFLAQTEDGTFQFNEMAINFSTKLSRKLRLGMQFFVRDMGDIGNDEIIIDWAYADYRWRNWLGFRIGKMKSPNGLYNETRDLDMLRTSILLPQSVYNENSRETMLSTRGISLYGRYSFNAMGTISYKIQTGTIYASKDSGAAKFSEDIDRDLEVTDDFHMGDVYIGSLEWQTPLEGLRLAITGRKTDLSIEVNYNNIPLTNDISEWTSNTFSMEYTWENLILVAEYYADETVFTMVANDSTLQPFINSFIAPDTSIKQEGYYGSLSHRLTNWFEYGIYHSVYYRDKDDKHGYELKEAYGLPEEKAWLKDTCLSLRFDLNLNWSAKLESHIMNGAGIMLDADNLNDDGIPEYEEDWVLYAVKVSYVF